MSNVTFDAETHRYWLSGNEIPSVTTIMKKLKLTPYYSQSPDSQKLMDRGTKIHTCTQYHDEGRLHEISWEPEYKSFLDSWISFRSVFGGEPIEIEQRLASNQFRYAGTLDRVFRLRSPTDPNGYELAIIDIKTGGYSAWHSLQLAAYQIAYEEEGYNHSNAPIQRIAVYLTADSFQMREFRDDADLIAWKAAVALYYWKERNR
tara:strand:- start:2162 stop:2773 length:612 start_codon:yes stop_codon:yes gene_type:complete